MSNTETKKNLTKALQLGGFTVAELLITLGIIATIVTFTIPKLLNSQSTNSYNSQAKEVVSSLSQAVLALKNDGISTSTEINDLTPYLSYVSIDAVSNLDGSPGDNGFDYDCSDSDNNCLKLHGGGTLNLYRNNPCQILGESYTDGGWVMFSPDSSEGGTDDSIWFFFNLNGDIKTWDQAFNEGTNDACAAAVLGPLATPGDPDWFSW